ncbi:hypothetical protein BDP81DRAFT_176343 [Colletotrichum phormii]|uniref:Uncharacterized protein n=1 Tax=Colletotrichum phormii TaxID=359342 RepID=A0AAI9ZW94_9PEZI|nr:uncharacterized protein BDP81DRAFT_176343 [Colletotrichum phormii]KAK1639379.1 hypothetical protein BDP81DRAFT_176343 [Colletotrichum phormii]
MSHLKPRYQIGQSAPRPTLIWAILGACRISAPLPTIAVLGNGPGYPLPESCIESPVQIHLHCASTPAFYRVRGFDGPDSPALATILTCVEEASFCCRSSLQSLLPSQSDLAKLEKDGGLQRIDASRVLAVDDMRFLAHNDMRLFYPNVASFGSSKTRPFPSIVDPSWLTSTARNLPLGRVRSRLERLSEKRANGIGGSILVASSYRFHLGGES